MCLKECVDSTPQINMSDLYKKMESSKEKQKKEKPFCEHEFLHLEKCCLCKFQPEELQSMRHAMWPCGVAFCQKPPFSQTDRTQ